MEPSEQDVARAVAEAAANPGKMVQVETAGADPSARCYSCDHLIAQHDDEGCTFVVVCALVTVEDAGQDAVCPCGARSGRE